MIEKIKENRPLILCLTNSVSENLCANVLLAIGASPLMSHALNEIQSLIEIADALYLNIGTLDSSFLKLAYRAIHFANEKNMPILLDPVGAAASEYRYDACINIIDAAKAITIKGNASEIIALTKKKSNCKGVDAQDSSSSAKEYAQLLLQNTKIKQVIITGETDIICSLKSIDTNNDGHILMTKVTGMGCALGALLSAALTVYGCQHENILQALSFYNKCGNKAFTYTDKPGSFLPKFLDALYQ